MSAALGSTFTMQCHFRDYMASRDLSGFHELMAPHLAAYDSESSESQQHDLLTHLYAIRIIEGKV
jgi:hypothetical protein